MATQYTSILKLALPVTGELSGTWGDVVNNNITSMIEQAIAGLSTINTWTANAHTLTVADGTTSESRCAMLVAATGAGGTALTAAGEIICPAASKLYVLKNGAAYAVTLKTAAGTGVAVPAGDTAFLFCDGTNVNACVTTIVNGHISGNLTVDGNTTLGDANTDTVTVTAQFASDLLPSTDNARDLGSTAKSWRTLYCDTSVLVGNLSLAGNTLSSTDTNGNIVIAPNGTGDVQLDADTVRVGDSNANATITTNGTGDLILNTNAGTNSGSITIEDGVNGNIVIAPNGTGQVQITNAALDLTTIEVTNIKAKDGTAALSIADSTGAVTVATALTANGGAVFNENGADVDFRVEGDTDANLIFADASTDRVGIGTNTPGVKLDIAGNATVQNGVLTVGKDTVYDAFINSPESMYFNVDSDANSSGNKFTWGTDRTGNTGGTTWMTLDSSGNLGLGVTPSAWGSGRIAIDMGANAYVGGTSLSHFTNNVFFDGTNFKYKTTAATGMYQISGADHIWFSAPSGTAGNTISFTQAMTLDASGNLVVGNTSALGKLDIGLSGTARRLLVTYDDSLVTVKSAGSTANPEVLRLIGDVVQFNTGTVGSGTERARITSGGYFKASDAGTYESSSGSYHELRQTANNVTAYISCTNTSQTQVIAVFQAARNTTNNTFYALSYYNTGAGASKFLVADSGDVTNTNGTYGTISDQKMKTDIVDAGSQWSDIKALRFRKFKMKDDPSGLVQLGVVAQEVELTSPGLVDEHADKDAEGNDLGTTTKSVKTSVLLMKAAVALQEAMARIEKLEAEVAALKGV